MRRIKFWLLTLLVNDITSRLIKKNGHVRLTDIRVRAEIIHAAMEAWELRPEDKEESNGMC